MPAQSTGDGNFRALDFGLRCQGGGQAALVQFHLDDPTNCQHALGVLVPLRGQTATRTAFCYCRRCLVLFKRHFCHIGHRRFLIVHLVRAMPRQVVSECGDPATSSHDGGLPMALFRPSRFYCKRFWMAWFLGLVSRPGTPPASQPSSCLAIKPAAVPRPGIPVGVNGSTCASWHGVGCDGPPVEQNGGTCPDASTPGFVQGLVF